jgi:hypothetical protein
VFVPAGEHCPLAGPRYGLRGLLTFTEQQRQLTKGTWVPRPDAILTGPDYAAVLVTVTPIRNGRCCTFHLVHVWQVHQGRARSLRSFADDQYAYDDFFADASQAR